jgi:cytochrome c-type biogenesis protein CcmH/NrfF
MSERPQFQTAYRQLRESELRCPSCQDMNIPGKPNKIVLDAHLRATCDTCGFVWMDKEQP